MASSTDAYHNVSIVNEQLRQLSYFNGLVVMGSYGAHTGQSPSAPIKVGSDIDLLCLINPKQPIEQSIIDEISNNLSTPFNVLLTLKHNDKLVLYVRQEASNMLKIDMMFAHEPQLQEKSRYLWGSECLHLYSTKDKTTQLNIDTKLSALRETKAKDQLNDYQLKHHVQTFLEYYELFVKSIARRDVYRCEFYLFLLRHSLVTMECIGVGNITEHLYLPKQAFEKLKPSLVQNLSICSGSDIITKSTQICASYRDVFLRLCDINKIDEPTYAECTRYFQSVLDCYQIQ